MAVIYQLKFGNNFLRCISINLQIYKSRCSESDCPKSIEIELEGLKVTVHHLSSSNSKPSVFSALVESYLDEALVLDLNDVDFAQLNYQFDAEAFTDTGLLLWRGDYKTRPDSPIWRILNMACVDEFIPSSRQFLIRKSSPGMLLSLYVASFMHEGFYNTFLASPVDMLRFAARSVGAPYHLF